MPDTHPRVDSFFARQETWLEELKALRAILLDTALTEDFKWRSPVYTLDGGNVAIIWGFKDHAALGFFKGVLLKDPAGILAAPGENSRSSRIVKLTSVAEIRGMEATLKDYVLEAIAMEKAGLRVDFPKDDLDCPAELIDRLDGDPDLRAAWAALTPGRRRGYLLHFSRPKKSETRVARIERSAPNILAGKGFDGR